MEGGQGVAAEESEGVHGALVAFMKHWVYIASLFWHRVHHICRVFFPRHLQWSCLMSVFSWSVLFSPLSKDHVYRVPEGLYMATTIVLCKQAVSRSKYLQYPWHCSVIIMSKVIRVHTIWLRNYISARQISSLTNIFWNCENTRTIALLFNYTYVYVWYLKKIIIMFKLMHSITLTAMALRYFYQHMGSNRTHGTIFGQTFVVTIHTTQANFLSHLG